MEILRKQIIMVMCWENLTLRYGCYNRLGRVLHPGFSIGANVKFIYSDLNDVSASGIGVDVAGTYFNDENFLAQH